MKKKTNTKKLLLASIGLLMGITCVVTPTVVVQRDTSSAATSYSYTQLVNKDNFVVTLYKKDGSEINYNNLEPANSIIKNEWANVKYFTIEYNTSSLTGEYGAEFNYTYSATWTPLDCTSLNTIPTTANADSISKDIKLGKSTKYEITNKIYFYVDELPEDKPNGIYVCGNDVFGESYIINGGWGLYQFSFDVDGGSKEAVSYAFYLAPTDVKDIEISPNVTYKKVSSTKSMDNAYLFEISSPEYKYVKRSNLEWYVNGTSSSGEKYVLLYKDINGQEGVNSIIPNNDYDRTGNAFLFDFGIAGTWDIQCKAISSNNADTKASSAISVPTIRVIQTTTIIWIVAGAVAVAATLLAIIIVVAKKKERIW